MQMKSNRNSNSIFDCTEPFAKWYCLNGATCFAVKIQDSTLYNCWCPSGFQGVRCEYKYVERNNHQSTTTDSTTLDYSELTVTLTIANVDKKELSGNIGRHQDHQQLHQIFFNLIIILATLLLVLFVVRFIKKKGINVNHQATIERLNYIEHLRDIPTLVGQANVVDTLVPLERMNEREMRRNHQIAPVKNVFLRNQQQNQRYDSQIAATATQLNLSIK